jgi:hypothetical protein
LVLGWLCLELESFKLFWLAAVQSRPWLANNQPPRVFLTL